MRAYVTLDLETTGLEPRKDRIIEIGAVKVQGGMVTGEYANTGESPNGDTGENYGPYRHFRRNGAGKAVCTGSAGGASGVL